MPDWIKMLAEIDVDEGDLDAWQCPNCGFGVDDNTYYDDPDMFLGSWDFQHTGNPELDFSTATWMEKWRCPECGTVWEFQNDNI